MMVNPPSVSLDEEVVRDVPSPKPLSSDPTSQNPDSDISLDHPSQTDLSAADERVIKRVVCIAIDDSDHSRYAFDWALENVVEAMSDQVVLLHVRPIPTVPLVPSTSYTDYSEWSLHVENANQLDSHSLLKTRGAELLRRKIRTRAIALRGDPREEIVSKVRELKAQILVMGSRGMG
ncbi:hypothetical protein HK102_008542, partial [Quaeritorhiza haematococci]